jgi:excisionase family DNA binding protein
VSHMRNQTSSEWRVEQLPNESSSDDKRMNSKLAEDTRPAAVSYASEDCPLTVRAAASYLGVSPQTVYLWVERKQIPHLRVMGRNIRFLRADLESFRAQFKQAVEWQDQ